MEIIKKNKNRISIIAFVLLISWMWIIGIFIIIFNHDYYVKTTDTAGENRAAAKIEVDNLWNSGESISSYIDDKIPFRNYFISFYKKFSSKIDNFYQRGATKVGSYFYHPQSVETVEKQGTVISEIAIDEEEFTKEEENTDLPEDLRGYFAPVVINDVLIGRRDFLFMYGENSIDYYMGTNILDDATLEEYAAKVNRLKEICDARGIALYIIFPPNKDHVYPYLMPSIEIVDSYTRTQRLADYLNANTSVPVSYPLDKLIEKDNIWQQYYKFDSHWNTIGAFTGCQCLYEMMGEPLTDAAEIEGEYRGAANYDLAVMAGMDVTTIGDQGEYVVNYRPDIYVEGLDTDALVCRTTSNSPVKKNFVLIGDSFRTAMMEYLTKDFGYCTIAHRSNISEINDDITKAQIIVIETVERQDYQAFEVVDYLINLLQ